MRDAVVTALLALAGSADFRDRADAGRALAQFVGDSRAGAVLVGMLADDRDTMVTLEVAEALMRTGDPRSLEVVAAGLGRADANHADWILSAATNVFMIYERERDDAVQVLSELTDGTDEPVTRGAREMIETLSAIEPVLRPR